MIFRSTRGIAPTVLVDAALRAGLAPDGGLYLPSEIPVAHAPFLPGQALAATATQWLAPFFEVSALRDALPAMCATSFAFDAPLRALHGHGDYLHELFHGPTAAFKDYAARFLAESLARLRPIGAPTTTILVATSGDTGAAVAAAFHRRPGFAVAILYPHGRVSPRQAQGLECWGDNVHAFRVDGDFDDCQRLVKHALGDEDLRTAVSLGSANSISLGRLLPQLAFHAHAALDHQAARGSRLNLVVPTGNLGNAAAAWLARRMGAPIGDIVLATNANDTLPRFFAGGAYAPQSGVATLANAMDVSAPSNFERLRAWHSDDAALRAAFRAESVDDATIRATIAAAPTRHGIVPCPHTATGLRVLERLRAGGDDRDWAVLATAHPAKFDTIVEPLVDHQVALPPALEAMLARPASGQPLANDYAALRAHLLRG